MTVTTTVLSLQLCVCAGAVVAVPQGARGGEDDTVITITTSVGRVTWLQAALRLKGA